MSETRPIALHRHPKPHRELARRYRRYISELEIRRSILSSIAVFAFSVGISSYAIQYATEKASNPVSDIILSNTSPRDVDGLFVFGTIMLIAYIALLLLAHPKRIPFVLYSLALFFFIRSAFITFTHVGPFPVPPVGNDWGSLARHFLFSSDLFFSAHTGAPFLLALIFWRDRVLRGAFLAWSVFLAMVVLLGHLHYTIDVASAYFITFTIYCIAEYLFPKARALFYSDLR